MRELKIESITPKDGLKISHRKENRLDRAFVAIDKKGSTLAELRIYYPATVAYACLWVRGEGAWANGSGSAGGYGYDKTSAATAQAFSSAGIKVNRSFAGTGESLKAMEALGRYLGKRSFLTVIEVYG